MTPEQEARDILERMGIDGAQSFSSGDVGEIAQIIAEKQAAEQRIDELLSANGSLQYKNDRLAAKTQRLEVAEKMASEARAEMVAAEQRAEQAERDAVRECESIFLACVKRGLFGLAIGAIHERYPQHFEEE